ncbi:MAG: HEAT repeat domain-containing protein [Planctomycetota bacterium]|jgi:HEAT repeat protein
MRDSSARLRDVTNRRSRWHAAKQSGKILGKGVEVHIPKCHSHGPPHLGVLSKRPSPELRKAIPPLLVEGLRDEGMHREYWWRACRALAEIGPAHPDVIPGLIHFVRHAENEGFRETAADELGDLGRRLRKNDENLTRIVAALADSIEREPVADVRREIIRALATIGPPAKEALPALRKAEDDPYQAVSDAAREAIGKIEAEPPERRGRGSVLTDPFFVAPPAEEPAPEPPAKS